MSGRRKMNFTASFLVLMLLSGCDPTGPAPIAGITVFARANYRGPHRTFVDDVTDLKLLYDDPQPDDEDCDPWFPERWTDCVSSIRVADGWQAIVYEHDTYQGESLTVTSDIPDLSQIQLDYATWTWDDRISSIRVTR